MPPTVEVPIKTLYVPVTLATVALGWLGPIPVAVLTAINDEAFMSFTIPDDFKSLVDAVIEVIPINTQAAANWDIWAQYGGLGEQYFTHDQSDGVTTYNVVSGQNFDVNVAGILNLIAAGDRGGVSLVVQSAPGHGVRVKGLRIRYR